MAQNLFEKYGIKEVADVTLFRIERKDETYESQRKISISSILKGALTKEVVYPLDSDGKGEAEGYEAYVFKDANVLTHYNYDCDDIINVNGTAIFVDNDGPVVDEQDVEGLNVNDEITDSSVKAAILDYLSADSDLSSVEVTPNLFYASNVSVVSLVEQSSNKNLMDKISGWLANGRIVKDIAYNSNATKKVVYEGKTETADTGAYIVSGIETWKSYFVTPVQFDGITLAQIKTAIGENGLIIDDGTTIQAGSYITFTAPAGASPETIMDRFALVQQGLYNSVGVIIRLTQPVKVSTSTETTFSGTITVGVSVSDGGSGTKTGTVTITFANTVLEDISGLSEIINSVRAGNNVTAAQLGALVGYAETEDTITVEYTDVTASDIEDVSLVVTSTTLAEDLGYNVFMVYFSATIEAAGELETGVYDMGEGAETGHYHMDNDAQGAGTHEFSYPEQVCMLYAKNQDLITKAGTRYQFANPDALFGNFEFNDSFATTPNGKERVVVVGLSGRVTENLYNFDEINEAIRQLTDTIEAKAYDITYSDYAELIVEDEMGYYLPQQLGGAYDKRSKEVTFFTNISTYGDWAKTRRGIDMGIYNAVNTWGDDTHYSINDAIDALKQQAKLVDAGADMGSTGYTRVFGGYKVVGESAQSQTPLDDIGRGLQYEDYTINGNTIYDVVSGNKLSSAYNLEAVLNALSVANLEGQTGQIRITSTAQMESNRAIYVNPETGAFANSAFIYLLKNVNGRGLATDKDGIFEFYDKKGNRLYYQDKVFAGTAYLALVVIGTMGLVFVANRHCTKNIKKTAWMINDGGYLTDKQAELIVRNGLIHTVSITECNETFDATCTVATIKVRKTKKNVLHYTPVLFLDSLKVSTLEQAAETTDATGGRGNAKLITWDYGKNITLTIQDALYTPASMSAIWGGEHGDLKGGVKDTQHIDRMEKITAKRNFIIPAGNQDGAPTEGDINAKAVYYDPKTMEPFQDGTPIAEGEVLYKLTRSVAYDGNSIGNTIEVSADGFPGTYRVIGETLVRDKATGEDQRFQFIIPEAKMSAETSTITLEADGEPVVNSNATVKVA